MFSLNQVEEISELKAACWRHVLSNVHEDARLGQIEKKFQRFFNEHQQEKVQENECNLFSSEDVMVDHKSGRNIGFRVTANDIAIIY